jgi:hypothetical protein
MKVSDEFSEWSILKSVGYFYKEDVSFHSESKGLFVKPQLCPVSLAIKRAYESVTSFILLFLERCRQ